MVLYLIERTYPRKFSSAASGDDKRMIWNRPDFCNGESFRKDSIYVSRKNGVKRVSFDRKFNLARSSSSELFSKIDSLCKNDEKFYFKTGLFELSNMQRNCTRKYSTSKNIFLMGWKTFLGLLSKILT